MSVCGTFTTQTIHIFLHLSSHLSPKTHSQKHDTHPSPCLVLHRPFPYLTLYITDPSKNFQAPSSPLASSARRTNALSTATARAFRKSVSSRGLKGARRRGRVERGLGGRGEGFFSFPIPSPHPYSHFHLLTCARHDA